MKKKILVVDNHPMILKYMADLLEKQGHQVKSAVDGISALDVLNGFVPDIMFIDLVMPNISGEKLCRMIRNNPKLKHVFICILSAIAAEQEVDFGSFGANACIAKGPLNRMSQYVLSVLKMAQSGAAPAVGEKTMGLEEVYKRHITRELLRANRHFEIILGNMSQGIMELNPDGRVVYVNQVGLQLTGLTEENLLGTDFRDLFPASSRRAVGKLLAAGKREAVSVSEEDPLLLRGKEIALNLIPVSDENRSSIIVIYEDVGLRRKMKLQLVQAQKMQAISTLAGGIAHEFNNALQGIAGNLELLELKVKEGKGTESFIDPMRSSIERMSSLTDQLLAYAEGGKYQPKIISLDSFVDEILVSIQHTMSPYIEIETSFDPSTCRIKADTAQLQMTFLAVLKNAEEAIEGGGRIRISTRNAEITHSMVRNQFEIAPGSYACLCIEDDGSGMDEDTRLRVFEPFFTTKFQGRGFGMAAVYGIIKNHGGWIDISSQKGVGSSIAIYLPAAAGEEECEPGKSIPADSSSGTVLVIDDEDSVLKVTGEMLTTIGYRVLGARSGTEALRIVGSAEEDIHAAILDIGLPDLNGRQVFSGLREARPDMKILLSSGCTADGTAREIMDMGADDFLQKPYTLSALSVKLRELLAR